MERDALLAHGTSFLLQDRLMNCSDYSTAWVCRTCGSMVSLGYDEVGMGKEIGFGAEGGQEWAAGPGGEYCRSCRAAEEGKMVGNGKKHGTDFVFESLGKGADMEVVAVPFVFRLLVAELARYVRFSLWRRSSANAFCFCSMGIQVTVGVD